RPRARLRPRVARPVRVRQELHPARAVDSGRAAPPVRRARWRELAGALLPAAVHGVVVNGMHMVPRSFEAAQQGSRLHLPYQGAGAITALRVGSRRRPESLVRLGLAPVTPGRERSGRPLAVEPVVVGPAGDALGQQTRGALSIAGAEARLQQG